MDEPINFGDLTELCSLVYALSLYFCIIISLHDGSAEDNRRL